MEQQETEDLQRQQELALLRINLQHLEELVQSRGWVLLRDTIKAQVLSRQQTVFATPLEGMDGALGQEFMKGEGSFGALVMALPAQMIDDFTNQLEQMETFNQPEGE